MRRRLHIARRTWAFLPLLLAASFVSAAYEISGVVLSTDREPVAGASLWLSHDRNVRVQATGDDGRFRFGGVPSGPVDLIVFKSGLALGGTEGHLIEDVETELVLDEPEATIVRIMDESYDGISGARLKELRVNEAFTVRLEDLVPHGFPSLRSDSKGRLRIPFLPTRGYAGIAVSHPRFAEANLPSLPVGATVDLAMADGVKLRGRITAEDGSGVGRARVSVFRVGDGQQFKFSEVLTDAVGFYTAIVPPAYYHVAAKHPEFAVPRPGRVSLGPTEEGVVDLVLPAPHRLRGRTVDANGDPLPAVDIAYEIGDVVYNETKSDVAGEFSIVVSSGKGLLRIAPPPHWMTQNFPAIELNIGDEPAFELQPIVFDPLPSIVGRITAREDIPLDKVLIRSTNLEPPKLTTTDAEGRFEIHFDTIVRGGPVRLRAEHALRFLRADFEFDLHNPIPREVRLKSFRPRGRDADAWSQNDLESLVGEPAPGLRCDVWFNTGGESEAVMLAGLRGKVVILTLWGGFDTRGPTRLRMDELNAIRGLYADVDDVAFVSVHDGGNTPPEVAQYIEDFGVTFPVGRDADNYKTFLAYKTRSIPQTVIIDKKGIVRYYKVDGRILELVKDLRRR